MNLWPTEFRAPKASASQPGGGHGAADLATFTYDAARGNRIPLNPHRSLVGATTFGYDPVNRRTEATDVNSVKTIDPGYVGQNPLLFGDPLGLFGPGSLATAGGHESPMCLLSSNHCPLFT